MKRYLLQYQRIADEIVQEDDLDAEYNNKMISELNLATSGYSMVSGHRPPDKPPRTNPRAKTPRQISLIFHGLILSSSYAGGGYLAPL